MVDLSAEAMLLKAFELYGIQGVISIYLIKLGFDLLSKKLSRGLNEHTTKSD